MSGTFYDKRYSISNYSLILSRFLFIPFLMVLALSCAGLSPVPASPEQVFAYPQDIVPRWQSFAGTSGLDYFAGRIHNPRLAFWAMQVDLTEDALEFVVSEPEPVQGLVRDGVIPSTKITSFVRRYDCLAGINTNPFSPVSGKEGEERTVVGITVTRGKVVALPDPKYDALVFYTDGRTAIVKQAELQDLDSIDNAVGGFSIVLHEGTLPERLLTKDKEPRHPRSAAGLSPDGKTLYLLVIDGRRPGSIGATESEIGIILKQLGAFDGLNFDGGGSTALALRYPDGKVRAVNIPIHKGIPKRERGVATCLGIRQRIGNRPTSEPTGE